MHVHAIRRKRRGLVALAALVSLSMVGAACGGDDKADSTTTSAAGGGSASSAPSSSAPSSSAAGSDSTTATSGGSASSAPSTTAKDAGEPKKGGEAEVLMYSEIGTLDPIKFTGSGGSDGQRAFALYGALVAYNGDTNKIEPVLAESITPNADFTEWTLKLKPGITFSDGATYDAAAVKANWDRAKDPANRSPSFTGLMAVGDLEVVDPLTLKIPLKAPNAQFPNTISGRGGLNYIASPKAIEAKTDMSSQAVGAGPFLLESWTRDDRMILKANPDWKGSAGPYLDKLTLRVVGDEQQRIDAFDTGDADAFYTATPESVTKAEDAVKGSEYTHVRVTTGQAYVFNTSKAPFDDVRVRKAFIQGVDWQGLADAVFGPGSKALNNFTLEGTDLFTADAALPPYDVDAAQKLIDEYTGEKGGPLVLNMLAFQQSLDQARAEYIQTALGQLKNIEVKITVNDSPTNIGLVLAGNFEISSWGFPVVATDPGIYNTVYSKALSNYAKYNNADVDKWLLEARATDDRKAQLDAYHKVFAQVAKDLPFMPYVETINGFVTSPELHGAAVYEDGILRFDLLWKGA